MSDNLRPEYKRSDFGEIVRGKYARRLSKATNVIVLDPKVAKAFLGEENVPGVFSAPDPEVYEPDHRTRRKTK
jgi:hypothetical protein